MVSNWLKLSFCLFFLSSCMFDEFSDITVSEALVSSEIVEKLQGSYTGCSASVEYPGYYFKVGVTIIGKEILQTIDMSTNSSCSDSPFYTIYYKYEFKKAAYEDKNAHPAVINVDLITRQVVFNFHHNYYVTQNYCGLNNWILNTSKDVTGISCADFLSTYDNFHTSFRANGEMYYSLIRLHLNGAIETSTGYGKSGDSPSERNDSIMRLSNKN